MAETPISDEIAAALGAEYGVSKCLVVAIAGLSRPLRLMLRQYVDRQATMLTAKKEAFFSRINRSNVLETKLTTTFRKINAKFEGVASVLNQLPLAEVAKTCAEVSGLLSSIREGASRYRIEGIDDVRNLKDEYQYKISRLSSVSTYTTLARQEIDDKITVLTKYKDLIDAM